MRHLQLANITELLSKHRIGSTRVSLFNGFVDERGPAKPKV